jgi:hypothetical protein
LAFSKNQGSTPDYPGIKKPLWQQILFRQTRGSVDYIIFPRPRKTFFLNHAKRDPLENETRKLAQFGPVALENPHATPASIARNAKRAVELNECSW